MLRGASFVPSAFTCVHVVHNVYNLADEQNWLRPDQNLSAGQKVRTNVELHTLLLPLGPIPGPHEYAWQSSRPQEHDDDSGPAAQPSLPCPLHYIDVAVG